MSKAKTKRRARNRVQASPPPARPIPRRRPVAGFVRAVSRVVRRLVHSVRVSDRSQLARRFLVSACIWSVLFGLLLSVALWQRFHPIHQVALFDSVAGGNRVDGNTAGSYWGGSIGTLSATILVLFGGGPVLLGYGATRWINATIQPTTLAIPGWHRAGFWTLWFAFSLTVASLFFPGYSTQAGWQWSAPLVLTGGPVPKTLTAEFLLFSGVLLAALALEMVVISQLATLFQIRSDHHDFAESTNVRWQIWLGMLAIAAVALPIVMACAVSELYGPVQQVGDIPWPALNPGIARTVAWPWLLGPNTPHASFGIAIVALACCKSANRRAPIRTINRNDSSVVMSPWPHRAWWATLLLMAATLGTVVADSLTALPTIQRAAMQIAWLCEATAWLVALMLASALTKWPRFAHSQRLAWVIAVLLSVVAAADHLGAVGNIWLLTMVPTSARLVAWCATVALAASLSTQRVGPRPAVYTSYATLFRILLITCVLIFIQLNLGSLVHQMPITASHGAMRSVFVFHLVVASAIMVHEAWLLPVAGWQFRRRFRAMSPVLILLSLTTVKVLLGMMMWVVQFGWTSWLRDYPFAAAYTVRAARVLPVLVTTSHLVIGYGILAVAVALMLRIAPFSRAPVAAAGRFVKDN